MSGAEIEKLPISRRELLILGSTLSASIGLSHTSLAQGITLLSLTSGDIPMSNGIITTKDGTRIFYKDWGPKKCTACRLPPRLAVKC